MRYFKQTIALLTLLFSFATNALATKELTPLEQMDSVEISLLTCSPGNEIWSLYGHTAIRFEDKAHHVDYTINYGMFDLRQKYFVIRFIFGLTDYQMGIEDYDQFLADYGNSGRGIVQQKLNLSRQDKLAIAQAIQANYDPAVRTYRYNYFYDNCTTRARDIITKHLSGKVRYRVDSSVESSYRQMIHQWNHEHRWMAFGCDLLLGVGADRRTTFAQQQFIPDTLRKDFDRAVVVDSKGRAHPLVAKTEQALTPSPAPVDDGLWTTVSPTVLFTMLFVLTLCLSILEYRRKKTYWAYDFILLTLTGLAGIVLFAMIFSQHPTVRVNLQILVLNPLSIVFAYSVSRKAHKGRRHFYW
ncbi:MAG TPA: hypothetical protein DEQ17_04230, partial [Prevotella sp.]|nr:hypothetical protein [Prevotella sp.]